ncbi:MAG TPA: glycosyltransferase family 4 protein [Gammaproteobacteria bacterium]|nr:glycosyltransferase family 4 protein [Gammaproteobacteria bacterium]
MKPLTLALVRQRYTMDGGAERYLARTLSTLQNRGVNIVLVTRLWQPVQSVQVLPCNPFYLGSLWRDWGFARRACKILAQQPVDLVQSHERLACCDIYRAGDGVHREWLKQRRRALGWWGKWRLALNPYHYYVRFAEKRLFNSARLRAVICNSQMVKEEIKRYFNLTEDKLHVIYSGIDAQEFHPDLQRHRTAIRERYAIPGNAVLFIFVGSGFERKGMDILLKAMSDLPEAAHLLIVGKDKKMHSFLSQAAELKVAARVHFLGAQQDVKPFYGAADVLVLPTLYDPFPNVILEAMAAGLPVITSTKCGAAELILKNNCGFVCDALDKAGLVSAMRAMLDTAYAKSLGRAARKTVEPISHDSMSMQLLSIYDELQSAREKKSIHEATAGVS